jgi:hypothetical protein
MRLLELGCKVVDNLVQLLHTVEDMLHNHRVEGLETVMRALVSFRYWPQLEVIEHCSRAIEPAVDDWDEIGQ